MIHTVSGVGFPKDIDVDLERYIGRGSTGGFQMRLFFQTMDTEKWSNENCPGSADVFQQPLTMLWFQGCGADGPLRGTGNRGVLYIPTRKSRNSVSGKSPGTSDRIHAIGDRAFDQAAKALKAALDDAPRSDHRHGIIHACLPTEEGLKNMRGLQNTDPLTDLLPELASRAVLVSGKPAGRTGGKIESVAKLHGA
jgi:hypothetical protein